MWHFKEKDALLVLLKMVLVWMEGSFLLLVSEMNINYFCLLLKVRMCIFAWTGVREKEAPWATVTKKKQRDMKHNRRECV